MNFLELTRKQLSQFGGLLRNDGFYLECSFGLVFAHHFLVEIDSRFQFLEILNVDLKYIIVATRCETQLLTVLKGGIVADL